MLGEDFVGAGGDVQGDTCDYYTPSKNDYLQCLPSQWLDRFDTCLVPFYIIDLDAEDVDYLTNPDIFIPHLTHPAAGNAHFGEDDEKNTSSGSWASLSEGRLSPPEAFRSLYGQSRDDDSDEEIFPSSQPAQEIPELEEYDHCMSKISQVINCLDGAVIPKLNWKVPKDARWIAFNKSLKCQNVEDILLLLKHSNAADTAVEMMNENFFMNGVTSHKLTLLKWCDRFEPEFEFRCFVAHGKLILISQRDASQAYQTIANLRDYIIRDVHDFFRKNIYQQFPLSFYVFDVMRLPTGKVFLLDFNVFGVETDPALTSYKELKTMIAEMEGDVGDGGVMGSGLVEPSTYGQPYFRYATGAVVASANPDLSCPMPLDMITHSFDIPSR